MKNFKNLNHKLLKIYTDININGIKLGSLVLNKAIKHILKINKISNLTLDSVFDIEENDVIKEIRYKINNTTKNFKGSFKKEKINKPSVFKAKIL